jgi:uncharacterized membrane protein
MNEENLKLFVAMFQDEKGAEDAIDALKPVPKEEHGIQGMVAIVKDQKNGIRYKDVGMTPAKGALGGVILGGALGILSGGATVVLGMLGAIVGGLMGERKRAGEFSSIRMNEIVASLVPGSSALVAVVEKERLQALEDHFHQFEAEIISAEINADLTEKLDPHRHTAYTELTEHLQS